MVSALERWDQRRGPGGCWSLLGVRVSGASQEFYSYGWVTHPPRVPHTLPPTNRAFPGSSPVKCSFPDPLQLVTWATDSKRKKVALAFVSLTWIPQGTVFVPILITLYQVYLSHMVGASWNSMAVFAMTPGIPQQPCAVWHRLDGSCLSSACQLRNMENFSSISSLRSLCFS